MLKKYLLIFVLPAAIFSCKPPAARNVEAEPDIFTQAYVDRAFPSWDVGVAGFYVQNSNVSLSIPEREFVVKYMAIMRVLVNTPEFEQKVLSITDPMYPYKND